MVEYNSDSLDRLFHALADPTRRAMVQTLAQRAATIGELAAPFAMSLAAASKHIRVLEQAGLIRREVQGRTHVCQLNTQPMHGGLEWIRHNQHLWNQQLGTLERLLAAEDAADSRSEQP